jgi:hypothetical protein
VDGLGDERDLGEPGAGVVVEMADDGDQPAPALLDQLIERRADVLRMSALIVEASTGRVAECGGDKLHRCG